MFETPQSLFRNDNYLLYMALYPDSTLRFSEKLFEIHCRNLEKWLNAVGKYIDIIMFGDDLGSNTGPLISPEMYREYYKPFHRELWTMVKKLAPHLKTQLHCCGSVEAFLPDLIDAGLDSINPVQISAKDMNLEDLKQKYYGQITFWGGGCDTQSVLCNDTPGDVMKHVRKQLDTMKGGGGFVFQQVHNIFDNVPVENILAMFETVQKYR
jgi:uroporphyrinogen decarboxylase